jgi:hypothetical protein
MDAVFKDDIDKPPIKADLKVPTMLGACCPLPTGRILLFTEPETNNAHDEFQEY